MKFFTASYSQTNPNFVIQNLDTENQFDNSVNRDSNDLLYVLKNILQRGYPTIFSKYLQSKLGKLHTQPNFNSPFVFISPKTAIWTNTIKGDDKNQNFPAKRFFEEVIPKYFGEFSFIQPLICPEVLISDIVKTNSSSFIGQQVDFYLPQAKLVIEIDGQQHLEAPQKNKDKNRDSFLKKNGITVIRIPASEIKNPGYYNEIITHLKKGNTKEKLNSYAVSIEAIKDGLSEETIKTKVQPAAIMRIQILIIELLLAGKINLKDEWVLNFILRKEERVDEVIHWAIEDFFIWFGQLYQLKTKKEFIKPKVSISYSAPVENAISINFSLFERWTDESNLNNDTVFVRTDYYGADVNYFRVSCSNTINFNVRKEDEPILEFFLQNIFEKEKFREGQAPIIANILSGHDTVGLLPTGSGKSLCYQLSSLLQPGISFVVAPLKSLMKDQHDNIKRSHITHTHFITGDIEPGEKEIIQNNFARGKYLFVWISPERFQIKKFRDYILSIEGNPEISIAHAIIDEVHCMSEWGHDFRTAYLNLTSTINQLCPNSILIGLTATASIFVLKDIKAEFAKNGRVLADENVKAPLNFSREELVFKVIETSNKQAYLEKLVTNADLLDVTNKAGLIFTPHVNGDFGCYKLSNLLNLLRPGKNKVKWYAGKVPEYKSQVWINKHEKGNPKFLNDRIRKKLTEEGLPKSKIDIVLEKKIYRITPGKKDFLVKIGPLKIMTDDEFKKHKIDVQEGFTHNKFPILVATKAFGMGIDKQNIYYTYHYGIPSSVESLYQEAGRAGRWVDKSKKAICHVLYTPETIDKDKIDKIFDVKTTLQETNKLFDRLKYNEGKDIVRNMQLFLQSNLDVKEEFAIIKVLISSFLNTGKKATIFYNEIVEAFMHAGIYGSVEALIAKAQKGFYRLRLLDGVKDWTNNFHNQFEVEFSQWNGDSVYNALVKYIRKYDPDINLVQQLENLNQPSFKEKIDKCIWYLLHWTFENIVYNRKQSLKTLDSYCRDFANTGNEKFKQRIDNYFIFTDTTLIFQYIGENPSDFKKWLEVFYFEKDSIKKIGLKDKTKVYIPSMKNVDNRTKELERVRDSLARFLETYRINVGLNFISGLTRLLLDDYEDRDGQSRFESAIEQVTNNFTTREKEDILEMLLSFGMDLTRLQQEKMSLSVLLFFPEEAERFANHFGLVSLVQDLLDQKVTKLKKINQKLYDQFEQI